MKNLLFTLLILLNIIFAINYSEDISPIIYNNCTNCHRSGEIGSFLPFTNYQEVFENRYLIAYAIHDDEDDRHGNPTMPPWMADREYSTFINEKFLTEYEINLFSAWIDEGAPQGNSELEFPLWEYSNESTIGEPDIVLSMTESYQIQAGENDEYRCFIFHVDNAVDIDISALEFRPGNRELIHHAVGVAIPHGSADGYENADPEYGYECFAFQGSENQTTGLIVNYLPGQVQMQLKHGLGQTIPANSDIMVQIHYPTTLEDTEDLSEINLFFSDEEVERTVEFQYLGGSDPGWYWPPFGFPPNEITEIYNSFSIWTDKSLISIAPHCHYLGKTWEVYYTLPGSMAQIPIVKIDEWNFYWQTKYYPEYPIHLPAGSTIHAFATYDNTADNPFNPNDPPDWVYVGQESANEMFTLDVQMVSYWNGDEELYMGRYPGDINLDDVVNILDVITVVNTILGTYEISYHDFKYVDLNRDYEIDVIDIIQVVAILLY